MRPNDPPPKTLLDALTYYGYSPIACRVVGWLQWGRADGGWCVLWRDRPPLPYHISRVMDPYGGDSTHFATADGLEAHLRHRHGP